MRGLSYWASCRMLSLLTFVAFASGCATSGRNFESSAAWIVPVRFIDLDGKELPVRDRPAAWVNELGIVPGAIFGKPRYLSRSPEMHPYDDQAVRLDFAELRTELKEQSTTITPVAIADGLKIEPADTRFARVATSIGVPDRRITAWRIGFHENIEWKDALLLAFFDRPCQLTGTLPDAGGITDSVNVTVATAGLIWLRVHRTRITTAAAPSHLVFLVRSPEK